MTVYTGVSGHRSERRSHVMVFSGGNKMVQNAWTNGINHAVAVMRTQAEGMKADAVICMRFAVYNGNLCATGTAVKLD